MMFTVDEAKCVCVKRDFGGDRKDFIVCSQSGGPGQKPGPSDFFPSVQNLKPERRRLMIFYMTFDGGVPLWHSAGRGAQAQNPVCRGRLSRRDPRPAITEKRWRFGQSGWRLEGSRRWDGQKRIWPPGAKAIRQRLNWPPRCAPGQRCRWPGLRSVWRWAVGVI